MVETMSVIAAVAMAVRPGALLLLHVLPTGYNPIRDAVSDYAIGRYRALFWTFATAGAVSGLTLAVALARSHPPKPTLTVAMLLLSAAARVLIPFFPTDRDGTRFQTVTGTVHMVLAVAIFASIAVAASTSAEPSRTNVTGAPQKGSSTDGFRGDYGNGHRDGAGDHRPPAEADLRADRAAVLHVLDRLVLRHLNRVARIAK